MTLWIIVPAAGVGQRFAAECPKQYQSLLGKTVLEWSIERLLALQPRKLVVAVNPSDDGWRALPVMGHASVQTVAGGASRAESVQNAVAAIAPEAGDNAWVLIHDAARPCVRVADIERLYKSLQTHPVGGILAVPMSDTIKRVKGTAIEHTVNRKQLWSALTPQMFRVGLLRDALAQGLAAGVEITDEASAVEMMGLTPQVVTGSGDNIKITLREDLAVAEAIIRYQQAALADNGRH